MERVFSECMSSLCLEQNRGRNSRANVVRRRTNLPGLQQPKSVQLGGHRLKHRGQGLNTKPSEIPYSVAGQKGVGSKLSYSFSSVPNRFNSSLNPDFGKGVSVINTPGGSYPTHIAKSKKEGGLVLNKSTNIDAPIDVQCTPGGTYSSNIHTPEQGQISQRKERMNTIHEETFEDVILEGNSRIVKELFNEEPKDALKKEKVDSKKPFSRLAQWQEMEKATSFNRIQSHRGPGGIVRSAKKR